MTWHIPPFALALEPVYEITHIIRIGDNVHSYFINSDRYYLSQSSCKCLIQCIYHNIHSDLSYDRSETRYENIPTLYTDHDQKCIDVLSIFNTLLFFVCQTDVLWVCKHGVYILKKRYFVWKKIVKCWKWTKRQYRVFWSKLIYLSTRIDTHWTHVYLKWGLFCI